MCVLFFFYGKLTFNILLARITGWTGGDTRAIQSAGHLRGREDCVYRTRKGRRFMGFRSRRNEVVQRRARN